MGVPAPPRVLSFLLYPQLVWVEKKRTRRLIGMEDLSERLRQIEAKLMQVKDYL
jgi:hypothetical protein